MGRKLIALTCALLLLTTACDPDDDDSGGTTTDTETTTFRPPPPPPPNSPPPRRVDEGCTQGEPRRLQVVNVNAPAQPIQSDIVPCTDDSGSRLSLYNTGIAVWTINASLGVDVWSGIEGEDLTSLVFRQSFGYNARLLPPKRRAVVYTPPRGVTWQPDVTYTGTWQVEDYLVGLAVAYAKKQVTEVFTKGSLRRDAVAACVNAAYATAKRAAGDPPERQVDALLAGLGTGIGAGTCAAKWQYANSAELTEVEHLTWKAEVARWGKNQAWHSRASGTVEWATKLQKLFRSF
jgi:hypothetical protein